MRLELETDWSVIDVEMGFLDTFSVVALWVGEAKETFLEKVAKNVSALMTRVNWRH